MRLFFVLISIVMLTFTATVAFPQVARNFTAQWQFAQCNSKCSSKNLDFQKAIVPGSVYSDLLRSRKVSSAFESVGEAEFRRLERSNWVYETQPFDAPDELYSMKHVFLRFKGLDTYATIELNGKQILRTNNAHRQWLANVRPFLKQSGNILRVTFQSTVTSGQIELNRINYPLPGDSLRAIVRTPQFHFGWDWAPRILSCGITHPIEWWAYDDAVVSDIHIRQLDVGESSARLSINISGSAHTNGSIRAEVDCLNNGQHWSSTQSVQDSAWLVVLPAVISNPLLWWSNGMGNPNITEFHCKVFFNDVLIEEKIIHTGLRKLQLITKDDTGNETFHFELNGVPVFAKGANYIPLSYFPADSDRDDYVDFLTRCRNANINMIRVWGGGYYEDDAFYDLCDEYGIMVWHDFMFACTMYPGDDAFIANVQSEAIEQVTRLRNHPCMALWCGNNEVSEGWQRWGWKDGLNSADQDSLQQAYERLFDDVLQQVVSKYSTISYHPSSPLLGRGDVRSQSVGDMHDWGIWHDELPLEDLGHRVPRFMSEFGVQSFPSDEVLLMISKRPFSESDSSFMNHQRHPRGFRLMRDYAKRWYPFAPELDHRKYAYLTQAVQAEGMLNAINHHRVNQPYCMGTLFWQLNDVWPSFSWSAMDYEQNEKLLFKLLPEAYAPQTVVAIINRDSLEVYWISDKVCDRDSAKLFLRWNKPGDALYDFADEVKDFDVPWYPCRIESGAKLLLKVSVSDVLLSLDSQSLKDWTMDCAIQIIGQEDLVLSRKFRPVPGSQLGIVPDMVESSAGGKNPVDVIRRQVFRKL